MANSANLMKKFFDSEPFYWEASEQEMDAIDAERDEKVKAINTAYAQAFGQLMAQAQQTLNDFNNR